MRHRKLLLSLVGLALLAASCATSMSNTRVYTIREGDEAGFVRLDPETGVETPLGGVVTHFLFSTSQQRDGAWALTTSDGSDSFCWSWPPAWPEDPEANGNTLQLLRPDDGVAHTLEIGANSFEYNRVVSIARGGWCAAVPSGTEWDAAPERFDLGTGERLPFPEGFAFGGWLD